VQAGEYVIMSSDFYKELIKLAYDRWL
jgi:hypothetical protein